MDIVERAEKALNSTNAYEESEDFRRGLFAAYFIFAKECRSEYEHKMIVLTNKHLTERWSWIDKATEYWKNILKNYNIDEHVYKDFKHYMNFEASNIEEYEPIVPKTRLNFEEIEHLRCGTRISNILMHGIWDESYTAYELAPGHIHYAVSTVEDLMRVTEHDFLKQRNAGKLSWQVLEEYRNKLVERSNQK